MIEETYIEKLSRWYCTLNSWEWPDDLSGKPIGWENFPEILRDGQSFEPNKYIWSGSIMKKIESIVSRKETLRWHHLHNLNKTNDEFELWWRENHYEN